MAVGWKPGASSATSLVQRVDSVEVGHYLQKDGGICPQRDSNSIAMVVETDGRHGKAVALRDSEGRYCYSGKVLTSGKTFQTIDGKRKEESSIPGKRMKSSMRTNSSLLRECPTVSNAPSAMQTVPILPKG